jgi:5-methylcytosine-specific restriction endonuclease McrA
MRAKDPRDQRRYKARRLQVLNASGWVCYYCGGEASQVDHVIPIASGGDPMSLDNLVPACKRCNLSKGKKSQGVFLATKDTPPVFSGNIYPMQSRPMPDSPFTARPVTDSPD